MNCIREAEEHLWYYRDMKRSLEHIERKLNKLHWDGKPQELKAVEIDGMPHANRQHDDMINIMYEYKRYLHMKETTELEIKEIDMILDDITKEKGCEHYKDVLKMWYIEKATKYEIALKIGYSERSVYHHKEKAIKKFAIQLFGLSALSA